MEEENKEIKKDGTHKVNIVALIVAVVMAAVIIGVVYACTANKDDDELTTGYLKTTQTEFWYATGAAVDLVEDKLKYPSSSEFQAEKEMTVYYDANTTYFTVKGYVDATNALNAKERKNFTAKFKLHIYDNYYSYYDATVSI